MKRGFLLLISVVVMSAAMAVTTQAAEQRTIQVTGTSSEEVAPDCVKLEVCLKEYADSGRVSIDKVEEEFFAQLKALGIAGDKIKKTDVRDMRGVPPFRADMRRDVAFKRPAIRAGVLQRHVKDSSAIRRRAPRFRDQRRAYEVTLNDFSMVDKIKNALDRRMVGNIYVADISSSKLDEYRSEVRAEALAKATDGAHDIAETAGVKLGDVVSVVVHPDQRHDKADCKQGVIKLRSSVTATFAIK